MTADEVVEKFNRQFPVGSTVEWRSIASDKAPHKKYTVSHPARNNFGNPVAWFNERSGMVSVGEGFVKYQQ